MSTDVRFIPKNNYYDTAVFETENNFTKKTEGFHVEDWRENWVKTGQLVIQQQSGFIADGLPVIRMINPLNTREFAIIRPYFVKDSKGNYKKDSTNKKVVAFASPFLASKFIKIADETCELEIIYKKPLGEKNECKSDGSEKIEKKKE